ncbi:CMP-N-acetylneuraminate-poly-alpha-2,8-sialyltransferase-like isoform X2 [Apostichopus japonicus]|uniref:CMP-N-acetylneuraminate-poly-alpha-2, 8-sialyltransferase-like isoform X2 n=1 Tax=Stichopus japonicus TaxID=307972 RepID=UPI003AB43F1E
MTISKHNYINMGRHCRIERLGIILCFVCTVTVGWWDTSVQATSTYQRNIFTISNISNQTAIFDEQNEKLFLYGKLLQREHKFNGINIERLREEIHQELGTNITNLLFVTKENSPIGSTLPFVSEKGFWNVSSKFYESLPKRKNCKHLGTAEAEYIWFALVLPVTSNLQNSTFNRLNRCSVVGNSGSLLHSNCGKHIDEAEFVYRCNAAPLKPFAADAGTKSNLTSFNPSIFRKRYKGIAKQSYLKKFVSDMQQYHGYLWGACFSRSSHLDMCMKAISGYNIKENVFVLAHPKHFKYFQDYWIRRGKNNYLSTGFYYTSDALSRCNETHLYGFWPFPRAFDDISSYNVSYHYFEKLENEWKEPHAMNIEFSILVQLHLLGVVKIHIGKCE